MRSAPRVRLARSACPWGTPWAALAAVLLCAGCATQPPTEFAVSIPSGVTDARGRFDEIFCTVLEQRGDSLPDYRPCSEALTPVSGTPPGDGRPVELGYSKRRLVAGLVGGIGFGCVVGWLAPPVPARDYLRPLGYDLVIMDVDALSGSGHNARQIRDAIMSTPPEAGPPRLVLMGYSKGIADILEAVTGFPEIHERVAAVVSVAGAVGGSPVADDASEKQADIFSRLPGADCDKGDDEAVASLRTEVRRNWLATHPLPPSLRYYSVVTLPEPDNVSWVLKPFYRKLSKLDPRNDGQVLYNDQFIPGSTLLAFLNADHWAVVLPIDRSHPFIAATFVNRNSYPRNALLEAVLRFVEEDLSQRAP
jgi:hypothetical protein